MKLNENSYDKKKRRKIHRVGNSEFLANQIIIRTEFAIPLTERHNMNIHQIPRMIAGAILALTLSLSLTASTDAWQGTGTPGQGAPFTGIVGFGDSLSDTGNFFALTGLPPAPYFEGRVSNGIVWIEYLAELMELSPESVVNYAYAGATTGRSNENDIPDLVEFPGLQDEIDFFVEDLDGKKADKRALYIVWAGANDFFVSDVSAETIATGVENTLNAVQRLHQVGARRIMVVNLPDLGLTPFGRSVDPAGLSFVSAVYNATLDSALDGLEAAGIKTIRVDSAGILQDVVANPGSFGFSNVVDAYLATGGDPSGFLFWDSVHPTTHGHFFIAEEAMRVLRSKFRHAWGTPRNRR
jgi:phospholipase/lecithinase/hemolysin